MFRLWWQRWFRRGQARRNHAHPLLFWRGIANRFTSTAPLVLFLAAANLYVWGGGYDGFNITWPQWNADSTGEAAKWFAGSVALFVAITKLLPFLTNLVGGRGQAATPPLVSHLEGDFANLVSALCPEGAPENRAVIFIDNLDRCTGLGVAETLRAIGVLVNEQTNVTVVMAIDRDRVAAALASEDSTADFHRRGPAAYRSSEDEAKPDDDKIETVRRGHHFLEKFIEATFRLPAFSDEHVNIALGTQLPKPESLPPDWDDKVRLQERLASLFTYFGTIRRLLESNPRRLFLWKREVTLSLLTLSALGRVTPSRIPDPEMISVGQIARLQALLIVWPRFLGDLNQHHDLLA